MAQTAEQKREYQRKWRAANPGYHKEYARKWRDRPAAAAYQAAWSKAHPGYEAKKKHQWRLKNPEKSAAHRRRWHVKRKFKLTVAEYEAKLAAQSGLCAACLGNDPGGNGKWHLDHCHTTGQVRAFLCAPCNLALGLVQDDPARLAQLIAYLKKYQIKENPM